MHVTVEIPEDRAALYQKQAEAQGLTVDRWFLALAEQNAQPDSIVHLQITDREEWIRLFGVWADSHSRNVAALSDEAMSRASINP